MIYSMEGDLLSSKAECLVNGVNCEGVMGKGIAFQFKESFPSNFLGYVEACRTGECSVGRVFFYEERGKLIANFPSKNRWRQPSRLSYITSGLVSLVDGLKKRGVKTVAVPPLGCGNGGLNWTEVRVLITDAFKTTDIDVYLYEPSDKIRDAGIHTNAMNEEHLVLLRLASRLEKNNMIRLEAAAFMMNLFRGKDFFKFDNKLLASSQIESLSKDIRIFKASHKVDAADVESVLYNRIVSEKVTRLLNSLEEPVAEAVKFVNSIEDDSMLKASALIIDILREKGKIERDSLIVLFLSTYSSMTDTSLSSSDAEDIINSLMERGIIESDLFFISLAS